MFVKVISSVDGTEHFYECTYAKREQVQNTNILLCMTQNGNPAGPYSMTLYPGDRVYMMNSVGSTFDSWTEK